MAHHHHHKHHKSHFSFGSFINTVSKPLITVERDINGVFHHGLDTLGKFGSSIGFPLLLIGGFGVAYIVINHGKLQ